MTTFDPGTRPPVRNSYDANTPPNLLEFLL
jgi:hypothetical protein